MEINVNMIRKRSRVSFRIREFPICKEVILFKASPRIFSHLIRFESHSFQRWSQDKSPHEFVFQMTSVSLKCIALKPRAWLQNNSRKRCVIFIYFFKAKKTYFTWFQMLWEEIWFIKFLSLGDSRPPLDPALICVSGLSLSTPKHVPGTQQHPSLGLQPPAKPLRTRLHLLGSLTGKHPQLVLVYKTLLIFKAPPQSPHFPGSSPRPPY